MATRGAKRSRGGRRRGRGGRVWIGGLLSPPFFVTDPDEPYRPGVVAWLDARDGLVVGQAVVTPEDQEGAVARVLLTSMEQPLAGPPRRPDRIRVADASLAAELRAALGDTIPVDVAPTPELDALLELMLETMPEDDETPSYLEEGRISPDEVAELFRAAEVVYRMAPWETALEGQVLRMDIPALEVEGACLCIIGNYGESHGLLIFPSLAGYEAFAEAAEQRLSAKPGSGPVDFGSGWLALTFERGADLPAGMRREVSSHGWPVVDANAYPVLDRRERDGAPRPLVRRDLEIATACATTLSSFFLKHESLFEADEFEPVCESWFDENDLEVRFTVPYEAFALFDVDAAPQRTPRSRPRVGRNDPCPCGSGRKYKKCHLPEDEAERASRSEAARDHDLDGELVRELSEYAMLRFGSEWYRFAGDFFDSAETLQLAVPWSVYEYRVQDRTVVEWYLAEHGRQLSRAERAWLAAQQAAWLSVWEVVGVEPGETVTLRDLLSHEERCVREASASRTLVVRDAMLARIVDHEGVSLLCGAHPRPLPPIDAAEVVRRARGRLRRKRAVPIERLRDEAFGRYLIARWEEAVEELDLRVEVPPELQNTDGEPLLLTTDHFEVEPGARAEVEARLAGIEGADPDASDEGEATYHFLRPGNPVHASWENTLIGRAHLAGETLRLETNSIERADALRARVEAACGALVRHRAREHTDPLSPAARAAAPESPPEAPPPEAEQLLLEFKRRHYADWLEQSIPALGGLSPREAVRTAQGRNAVDVLLKDMENHERRHSGPDAFDFDDIRRELGMAAPSPKPLGS